MKNLKIILPPLLITIVILLVPFFGNIYVDGWNWSWTDFVIFGAIMFFASLGYELTKENYKQGVIYGFIFGEIMATILIATLRYSNPSEDIAGFAVLAFLSSGLFFGFLGYLIQKMKFFSTN